MFTQSIFLSFFFFQEKTQKELGEIKGILLIKIKIVLQSEILGEGNEVLFL